MTTSAKPHRTATCENCKANNGFHMQTVNIECGNCGQVIGTKEVSQSTMTGSIRAFVVDTCNQCLTANHRRARR